jgi:hypothetical protein
MKSAKDKQLLIEQLKKTPIVQVSVEKVGIARATYYRWLKTDKKFATTCAEAIDQGTTLVSEIAEAQLISAIKDKNLSAITYWLNHRHPDYVTKLKLDANIKHEVEELTPEQDELVTKALRLAGYISEGENNEKSSK